jgi:hypothetical protein
MTSRPGWLCALAVGAIAVFGCSSTKPAAAPRAAAPPKSSFGQSLSLSMSFGSGLAAGDTSVTASFTLKNNAPSTFEGCFGPSWGVSVIVGGEHDAGHIVRSDHPGCVERFTLLPSQTIAWSRKVPFNSLRAGTAKVTGWVKLVDPAACDPSRGCHEASIATPLMTVAIAGR